jgi:hypothetical protein
MRFSQKTVGKKSADHLSGELSKDCPRSIPALAREEMKRKILAAVGSLHCGGLRRARDGPLVMIL